MKLVPFLVAVFLFTRQALSSEGDAYGDYSEIISLWDSEGEKPCGWGTPLARMVCLPWNYTKEYRPEDVTAVNTD